MTSAAWVYANLPVPVPEPVVDYLPTVLLVLDLTGVFFFAVSGSLLAAKRHFDIIGSMFLAYLVGLGGGVIRDLIIGGDIPNAFRQPIYLVPPLLAVALVYIHLVHQDRYRRPLLVFDAAGLALFCVLGTHTAMSAGMGPVQGALLGVATAVGGGVMRDVVANETPQLFNRRGVYAIPAMIGAGLASWLEFFGWLNWLTGAAIVIAVFSLRVLSLRYGWTAPGAVHGAPLH